MQTHIASYLSSEAGMEKFLCARKHVKRYKVSTVYVRGVHEKYKFMSQVSFEEICVCICKIQDLQSANK